MKISIYILLGILSLNIFSISANSQTVKVYQPLASPMGRGFNDSIVVSLLTITDGAEIYYTLDGTNPTINSIKYSSPIIIRLTTNLRAVSVKDGAESAVVSEYYLLRASGLNRINDEKMYAGINKIQLFDLIGRQDDKIKKYYPENAYFIISD